jgi:hypothetical protein
MPKIRMAYCQSPAPFTLMPRPAQKRRALGTRTTEAGGFCLGRLTAAGTGRVAREHQPSERTAAGMGPLALKHQSELSSWKFGWSSGGRLLVPSNGEREGSARRSVAITLAACAATSEA